MDDLKEKLKQKVSEYLDNKNLSAFDLEIVSRIVFNLSDDPTPYDKTMQKLLETVSSLQLSAKVEGENKDDEISRIG